MTSIEIGPDVAEQLATTPLAWLTTVRGDGQPQSSYVWFFFDGTDLVVCSQPTAAKLRNIRSNPRASFHLDGDGQGGGVLTIDALAEIVDGEINPAWRDGYEAKYGSMIRTHMMTTPEELRSQFSTVLRLRPARLRSW
jgi:PPOX class probable F420-dependent enzyme